MHKIVALALVSFFALVEPVHAGTRVDGKPKVSFFATGSPGFLDIEGVSSGLTVADDGTTLTFTVPMESVKTGIDSRDDHMNHTYILTAQFPNAELKLTKAAVTWPVATAEKKAGMVKAEFTVHGVTRPVDVKYTVVKTKLGHRVSARFDYDAAQHGIAIPNYLGITVDPKMYAEVTADLVDG